MNIFVYGAGVIGTVYAAKLAASGHSVTVLARGSRLVYIRAHGVELEDIVAAKRTMIALNATDRLNPDDAYDLALVAVQRDQIAQVTPDLAANTRVPTFLFMLNNPTGASGLAEALGADRILLGFPGFGGTREGTLVSYALIRQQPTTLGELDGRKSRRLAEIAALFGTAGFPTVISRDMDAWLKVHAFFVTAICGAIYVAGADCLRLSRDNATIKLMILGIREGFACVRALELPVTPFPLKVLFTWLPQAFAVAYWCRFMAQPMADCVFGGHARTASGEMRTVADDCRGMLASTGAKAPVLERLYQAIDNYAGAQACRAARPANVQSPT